MSAQIPAGTVLRTPWGPARAGETYSPDDGNVQVIYEDGAVHQGRSLAGLVGAFLVTTVLTWATPTTEEQT